MKPSLVFFTTLVAGAFSAHSGSHLHLHVSHRARTSEAIDARDDQGLDEWLAANKRAPPSALTACPLSCHETGNSSSGAGWFLFPDGSRLAACNETMLLNFVVQNEVDGASSHGPKMGIRACTADYSSTMQAAYEPHDERAALCPTPNHALVEASIRMSHSTSGNDDGFAVQDVLAAGRQIVNYFRSQKPFCVENTLAFGYSQSAVVGVFAGAEVHQHGVTTNVLNNLLDYAEKISVSKTTVVQLCQADGRGADYGIGIIISSAKHLPVVQEAVKTWVDGRCVSAADGDEDWMTVTLRVPARVKSNSDATGNMTLTTAAAHLGSRSRIVARAECQTTAVNPGDGCWALADRCKITDAKLKEYNPRPNFCDTLVAGEKVCCSSGTLPDTVPPGNSDGTCKTRQVIGGDICDSLASKCGLSLQDFYKVNTGTNLCSNLKAGQHVCCTRGKLPDFRPKPNPDGSCSTYTTKADDDCYGIAAANGITVADIEDFNKKTWGWNGCKLAVNFKLCVSSGTTAYACPCSDYTLMLLFRTLSVPGTKEPAKGTDLSKLNPCPLKVCCNVWGQCGTTDDFCTVSKSETGAPGTSAPGKNGCISNCGRDIVKGPAPLRKIQVAYFEAWNYKRKCLTMDVGQIDTDKYTHIHFAFADVTKDFNVDISAVKEQFDLFKGMSGVKKIISFGGWDFSTMPGTFNILREAVKPANRDIFQRNLIAFVNEHNLDGIDLDWEYPGAPDIPDIPAGDPEAGMDYYHMLSNVKKALGGFKTVSFAAPASYHYLKSFPMEQMGIHLDYIIYMTYDLHGQWDYDNKWTSSGYALSMITKAGVPSRKVVVGVASYGRSFKMAEAGCTGPMCKFTGTSRISNAAKGRCTDTGGYISNAEIDEIINSGKVTKQWTDVGSNFLVYNDTEWVAYMDDDMKAARAKFYDSYNFAGTTDWAVDLQEFRDGSGGDDYPDDYEPYIDTSMYPECVTKYTTFKELDDHKDSIPAHCMEQYIFNVEVAVMEAALEKYKDLVNNGYDEKFKIYAGYVDDQVQDQIDAFMGSGKADKYFKCTETKDVMCCSKCNIPQCMLDCDKSKDCNGRVTVDITCPTTLKSGSSGIIAVGDHFPNATYTLQDSEGFWKDIGAEYGIEESWAKFGRRYVRAGNGCQYAGEDVKDCIDKQISGFYNYPMKDTVKVYNPKDLIGDSYGKTEDLLNRLKIVRDNADYDELMQWSALVDAGSLPALTIQTAVESMDKIVKTAKDISKKEREEFIVNFLTGLLFFIPFVGEAAGATGLTAVRSMLRLAGAAGETGLLVHDIIERPENAFMSVFSYLAWAGVGRAGFKNAANARRSMKASDINNLGPMKVDLDLIETVRGVTCRI
ncbi:killer toxin subunits alpha/beta [Aspergillus udagawae]|uniref:chitinase n=1 Tax=Aspergillus udagawae TaxID=91492 RepID=A0ABQ1B4F7_9EURO|nr:killer toxin subunits alpha/beta [Aspergillus udagawae]